MDARELELKAAEERQRAELKETAQQAFEDELGNISRLKEELEKKEEELKSERAELEYERREIEERLGKLRTILEGGEVKRFVTGDVAKIHEMNYIGRFDIKMNELSRTIYDPIEKKERRINAWSDHYKFDDADKILQRLTGWWKKRPPVEKRVRGLQRRYFITSKRKEGER